MRVALPEIPQSVQQSLGREAAEDLSHWIEVILVERAVPRDEYRVVLSRLDVLEHDVADVKASIADLHRTMDERFDKMNERFDKMNERFDKVNERFDEMYRHISTMTRWTVGTLALLGTIITILMAIAQFTP
jgi:tetrahydromethanopterin S-methyltransferase subunit G